MRDDGFEGDGLNEVGIVEKVVGNSTPALAKGDVIIIVNKQYFRPSEAETLPGDPTKARQILGWTP